MASLSDSFIDAVLSEASRAERSGDRGDGGDGGDGPELAFLREQSSYKEQEAMIDRLQRDAFGLRLHISMLESRFELERAALKERIAELEAAKGPAPLTRRASKSTQTPPLPVPAQSPPGVSTGVNTSVLVDESAESQRDELGKLQYMLKSISAALVSSQEARLAKAQSVDDAYALIMDCIFKLKREGQIAPIVPKTPAGKAPGKPASSPAVASPLPRSKQSAPATTPRAAPETAPDESAEPSGFSESQLMEIAAIAAACSTVSSIATASYGVHMGLPSGVAPSLLEVRRLKEENVRLSHELQVASRNAEWTTDLLQECMDRIESLTAEKERMRGQVTVLLESLGS